MDALVEEGDDLAHPVEHLITLAGDENPLYAAIATRIGSALDMPACLKSVDEAADGHLADFQHPRQNNLYQALRAGA